MKTLKKSLALVLAVVMVVGVLAVSAVAATYPDDEEITYKDAVEVLTLLNVIQGFDDGSFHPTETLTREQAAKIVTYIVNQKSAESLSKTSTFTDVPDGYWSAGYIAYCQSTGIVAGRGDGTFDRTGTLTGAEWAKMLVCALGYDAEVEGLVGENWSVNAVTLSENLGLSDGIDHLDYDAAITREEACQMAFNALDETVVSYTYSGSTVEITSGDVNVSISSNATRKDDGGKNLWDKYFGTYEDDVYDTEDVFGRPATSYNHNGEYLSVATPVATFTTSVSGADIYKALNLKSAKDAVLCVDGAEQDSVNIAENAKDAVSGTGNGNLTQVFVVDGNYTVTVIESHYGVVDKVEENKGTVTVTVGDVTFETDEFEKGDHVVYTVAGDEVQSMTLAGVETGTVTKVVGSINSFVVDGTTYELSENHSDVDEVIAPKTEVNLYLDAYGYVIAAETVTAPETSNNYVFVIAVDSIHTTFGGNTPVALVVTTDGEVVEIELKLDEDQNETDLVNVVANCVENKDGTYSLTVLETSTTEVEIASGATHLATGVYANAKTIYVLSVDGAYEVYVGYKNVPSVSGKVDAYVYCEDDSSYATIVVVPEDVSFEASSTSTSNVFVYLGSKSALVQDVNGSYYTYSAVVGGVPTTIEVDEKVVDAGDLGSDEYAILSSVEFDANDRVVSVELVETTPKFGISFKNGVLEVESEPVDVADDVVIYVVEHGEISEVSLEDVSADEEATVVMTENHGAVSTIYIIK